MKEEMNMKINRIIIAVATAAAALTLSSCEDFLDRPAEDNYNVGTFYKNDTQCEQGVNYLYNSPWYDFQRGFIKIGEVMSGNMHWGSSPYLDFSTNGTDTDLMNMSYSLWAVNGHANIVIHNIENSEGPSAEAKMKTIGEALTWKAFAYFFLVRTFGEVPIIHDNTELLGTGAYNTVSKVTRANVYEYIIMTLEKAMELLPKTTSDFATNRRIDYYSAEALLAKVYLTRAGISGTINTSDMEKAAELALDVIKNLGRTLTPNYSDVFRLAPSVYNATGESLIRWEWTSTDKNWTSQNTLQSDLAMVGFDEFGDCWGGYIGPSVDLADAFGVSATDNPVMRNGEADSRRKATMMLPGDFYSYFWTDKTDANGKKGFNYLQFLYDSGDYGTGGPGQLQSNTGANNVKHLYGDAQDHLDALGVSASHMHSQLPTHLLRLSDVYLIYAEASFETGATDVALDYVNLVRERAGAEDLTSISRAEIWKERRLELAGEGDYWYDFVRRSYWQPSTVIAEIKAQRRTYWEGLDQVYKDYVGEDFTCSGTWDASAVKYNDLYDNPNITESSFTLPFPTEDVVFNGNMASTAEAQDIDVRATYSYNYSF